MRPRHLFLVATVGVLVGLGAGFLAFGSTRDATPAQPPTIAASPVPAGAEAPPGTAGGAPLRIVRRVPATAPAPAAGGRIAAAPPAAENAPEACKRWVEESVDLRTTVADLQQRLDQIEQQRAERQGQSVERLDHRKRQMWDTIRPR